MISGYRLIDHTADFGLEIIEADEAALFESAAVALFDLITDSAAVKEEYPRIIEVTGSDWPDLMVNWLRELLYLFNGEGQVVSAVTVTAIGETGVRATVTSGAFDTRVHEIRTEVKAVTYHQVEVGPLKNGWRAKVIFDI